MHKIRYVVALVLPDPVGNRLAAGDYFKRAKADKLTFWRFDKVIIRQNTTNKCFYFN